MKILLWFLLWLGYNFPLFDADHSSPNVVIPLGTIKGSILETVKGSKIYSFRGIRYAKAPVNELRFKPPVPAEAWQGTFDATEDGPSCPQLGVNYTSEDCLRLNVYTTKLPKHGDKGKRPVIVFFHPGGFYGGTGASFFAGPDYYLDQDIVLVTANYRIGSLGYLSTGTKESPGNYGFKDQVLVLKWIRDYIGAFGGNKDSVTVSGYSAGSCSLLAHMVSPMSKGLFHRGIGMSGTIFGNLDIFDNYLELAKKQARLVNCPDNTPSEIVECLRTKSTDDLVNSFLEFYEFNAPVWLWRPVVEKDFGQERFLTENPRTLFLKGEYEKIPILYGVDKDEFGGQLAYGVVNNQTILDQFSDDSIRVFPIAFFYERDTEKSRRITEGLRKFYFGDGRIDNSSFNQITKIYNDGVIGYPANDAVKLLASNGHTGVYYYKFTYAGRFSYVDRPGTTIPYGVSHHDDLIYLYHFNRFPRFNVTDPEYEMVEKLTALHADFAKHGEPILDRHDPQWVPFDMSNQKYMDIGKKLVLKHHMHEKRYKTWEKLFQREF